MEIPKQKREIILLRTLMGLSVSETAYLLGWTRNTCC
ncbi:sigma factor-like helix-turn-helix DNA-binding protein [Alicyclobacillus sp. SO9]|nr:hypothetical protein GI364_04505 [Alicyclobacillus sp. SO9]